MPDKPLTNENFQNKLNEKYPNQFTVIRYTNYKEKTIVKCNKCGKILERNPVNLVKRGKCEYCYLLNRPDELKKYAKDIINDYLNKNSLNEEYSIDNNTIISCKEKSKFFHKKCNKYFDMSIEKFKSGRRCPFCQHAHDRKSNEEFIMECKQKFPDYDILTNYETRDTEITIKHTICNHVFKKKAYIFLAGHGCPLCNGGTKLLNTEKAKTQVDKDYELLEYSGRNKKCKLKHNKCGINFEKRFSAFIKFPKCPLCDEKYYNEKVIRKFFKDNNINIESQKKFNNCKNIRELPFDFYISKFNLIVEYDGEQHYFPIFGREKLNKQKENDNIKNKFCKEYNIHLLRIPFWEASNITMILTKYIDMCVINNNIDLEKHRTFIRENIMSFKEYKEQSKK